MLYINIYDQRPKSVKVAAFTSVNRNESLKVLKNETISYNSKEDKISAAIEMNKNEAFKVAESTENESRQRRKQGIK